MPGSVGREREGGREENAPVVKPVVVRWWRRLRRAASNFYGALAWASSRTRARVHARSLELSSVPRPEGSLTVTLFGWRLFGGDRGKISDLRGRFGRWGVPNPLPGGKAEGRKVSLESY